MPCTIRRMEHKDRNMSDFFKNVWTKRAVSLLSLVYVGFIAYFAYMSVFYELILKQPIQTCILCVATSLIALITMLYTRKQFITKLASILMLPCMLLPVLMYFGQWGVLIPFLVVSLIIFFFSGMGETAKTVWGTIFLLLYLLGSLMYFLVTSMFAPSTVTTTMKTGTSPSGIYRYEVTQTVDSSNGSTKVIVESNELDKEYDMFTFQIKGLSRDVKLERPLNDNVTIDWTTEKREDITRQLTDISKDISVTLSDAQCDMLNMEAYRVTYSDGRSVTLKQADYHALVITLSEEDKLNLETDKDTLYVDSMGPKTKKILGITVEDLRTIPLSSLTDADLETLGVPEEGDVMYYNGKCVFRYYVAVLEQYFDIANQDLGLF